MGPVFEALHEADWCQMLGGGCFAKGTLVAMADGSHKPIEQVQVGDWVLSRNEATGETEARQVTGTAVHRTLQTVSVTLADAKTGQRQTIVCTPSHPFYVQGQGFTPAGSLGIGTSIVTRAGPCLAVNAVTLQPVASGGTMVYNLTVEGDHTYFVGTIDGGAWVHNAKYCGPSLDFQSDIQLSFEFPKNPLHHVFPQEFEEYWKAADIDMNRWTVSVRQAEHDTIHAGSRPGGAWNEEWEAYIRQNPVPNTQSAWQQAYSMMRKYGIYGRPFYKY